MKYTDELWNFRDELEATLREAGEEEWSTAIHDSGYGSTWGENFARLWVVLTRMRQTDVPKRLGVEEGVDEAIAFIDQAVGPLHL